MSIFETHQMHMAYMKNQNGAKPFVYKISSEKN